MAFNVTTENAQLAYIHIMEHSQIERVAGVSVTRTLPKGSSADVKREMAWLVEKGPRMGLFLSCASTVTRGVPWGNIWTLIEGLKY